MTIGNRQPTAARIQAAPRLKLPGRGSGAASAAGGAQRAPGRAQSGAVSSLR
jgi:hypothetical protein